METVVSPPPVPAGEYVPTADQRIVMHGVSWAQYEHQLAVRGEASSPRIAYFEGTLELMSPSRDHERIKSYIGRLVETYALERGIELSPYGSWTLKRKVKKSGVEPDECYLVGLDQSGKTPHLAIEVIWTSGGIGKLEIYARLGVGEVWFWKAGTIEVYLLARRPVRARLAQRALPGARPGPARVLPGPSDPDAGDARLSRRAPPVTRPAFASLLLHEADDFPYLSRGGRPRGPRAAGPRRPGHQPRGERQRLGPDRVGRHERGAPVGGQHAVDRVHREDLVSGHTGGGLVQGGEQVRAHAVLRDDRARASSQLAQGQTDYAWIFFKCNADELVGLTITKSSYSLP